MSEIKRTTLLLWLDRCLGFDFHLSPMADLPPIVSSLSDYQRQTVIISRVNVGVTLLFFFFLSFFIIESFVFSIANHQCEVHTGLLTWCCIGTLHLGTHLILIGYKKSVAVQVLTSYPRQFENSTWTTIRRENTTEWIELSTIQFNYLNLN